MDSRNDSKGQVGQAAAHQGCVPDQDHFLLELAASVELGADLVVEVEQLLERLGFGGHDESDDVHEQLGHWIAVQHDCEDGLHGLDLALVGALLELRAQLGHGGNIGGIVLVDQAVRILEEGGHVGGGGGVGSPTSFPRGVRLMAMLVLSALGPRARAAVAVDGGTWATRSSPWLMQSTSVQCRCW